MSYDISDHQKLVLDELYDLTTDPECKWHTLVSYRFDRNEDEVRLTLNAPFAVGLTKALIEDFAGLPVCIAETPNTIVIPSDPPTFPVG